MKLVVNGGQIRNNAAAGILVTGSSGTTVQTDIDGVNMVSSAPPARPDPARRGATASGRTSASASAPPALGPAARGHQRPARLHRDRPERRRSRQRDRLRPLGHRHVRRDDHRQHDRPCRRPRSGNENFFGIAGDIRDSVDRAGQRQQQHRPEHRPQRHLHPDPRSRARSPATSTPT